MGSWNLEPGLNNVGSFQVSGAPYASASIDGNHGTRPGGYEVAFPYVTSWFQVFASGSDSGECKVAFSVSGMTGSNYFTIPSGQDSGQMKLKVSSIWVSGSSKVNVVAGLTNIPTIRTSTGTPPGAGPNWSGSVGVG